MQFLRNCIPFDFPCAPRKQNRQFHKYCQNVYEQRHETMARQGPFDMVICGNQNGGKFSSCAFGK
ncbi:hypothetical protein HMPREF1326_03109 [Akkermansia sp. KLE1605]|nr:hypothetical protein HMPREF1326_03109 [Akkermansia sp. KLE1605]